MLQNRIVSCSFPSRGSKWSLNLDSPILVYWRVWVAAFSILTIAPGLFLSLSWFSVCAVSALMFEQWIRMWGTNDWWFFFLLHIAGKKTEVSCFSFAYFLLLEFYHEKSASWILLFFMVVEFSSWILQTGIWCLHVSRTCSIPWLWISCFDVISIWSSLDCFPVLLYWWGSQVVQLFLLQLNLKFL